MFRLFKKIFKKNQKYNLVISGGGTRGFYALGVLKGLEELGFKDKIEAVYGVSIGAVVLSYRCNGYSAQEIFDKFLDFKIFGLNKINFFPSISLLKNNLLKDNFEKDLPKLFENLNKKIYIGATDTNTGKFVLFDKGDLIEPLLGSIAIPGIFPHIKYKNHNLIDGGATNNFPVDMAKKQYPKNKIIGINLNKFKENQNIKTIFDTLSVALEILLRYDASSKLDEVDYLFYKDTGLKVLETKLPKIKKAFEQGYVDCLEKFN